MSFLIALLLGFFFGDWRPFSLFLVSAFAFAFLAFLTVLLDVTYLVASAIALASTFSAVLTASIWAKRVS